MAKQGEKLTFHQIFSIKKWKIEIPIIQRDYAQGREIEIEIRNSFLDALHEQLSKSEVLDLDFVYGRVNDSIFIPLDGQQRLTTLFLLYWYLAHKECKVKDFNEILVDDNKSKFTYKTRTSSTEFCDALVTHDIDLKKLLPDDENKKNGLSKSIKNSAWYFAMWNYDPTILSMMNMLDAINDKFSRSGNFFDKLINNQTPAITFQFIDLGQFQLTDELYIKMNARGKLLTPFENFKAKFEQFSKEFQVTNTYKLKPHDIQGVTIQEYFSHKIDTEWADLFWNYRDCKSNIYDAQFQNFFRVMATNNYAKIGRQDEDFKKNMDLLRNKNESVSFMKYQELNCFDKDRFIDIIETLDKLKNGVSKIKTYLTAPLIDLGVLFEKMIQNNSSVLEYAELVEFYAFIKFITYNNITKEDEPALIEWMRVIRNLVDGTKIYYFNKPEEYSDSLQFIEELLPYSKTKQDLLQYIAQINKLSGFPDWQIAEEKIKATLILKDNYWEDAIKDIENQPYFNGQISFLLNFSGIEDYYNEKTNFNWTVGENRRYYSAFTNYSKKAKAVFNSDGLMEFSDFAWERALLSKGNYLLHKASNFSFLINNERDIGWKRLLRDDKESRRELVKQVLDDPNFNTNDVQNSLNNIIQNALIQNANRVDYDWIWRKHFIKSPALIEYLGSNKYIRWITEHEIYLLRGVKMSGTHAEYYSYAFFIENLKGKKYPPFTKIWYNDISGSENQPSANIDDWVYKESNFAIEISYNQGAQKFQLKFFDRNNKSFDGKLLDSLEKAGFQKQDEYCFLDLKFDNTQPKLNSICDEFAKKIL